ncbi:MAG: glycoside hydrolase family 5 protein [Flammeovirgaceae bacterium]|nr:glycoside hydrolase family 5 protein [Flammeovirgaceae bacterium]NQW27286.1 glycoside hydrolase family 5 protein [Flammeovirgaceae bacterium]
MNSPIFIRKSKNTKNIPFSLVCSFLLIQLLACKNQTADTIEQTEQIEQTSDDTTYPDGIGAARDISSFDLVAEMGVGWSLGNSFDVPSRDKTLWGNPLTSKAVIDEVKAMGFKTLRIPVTWAPNQANNDPYPIEHNYLTEIKRIVDYGFQNKMHVIINVHHDNSWIIPSTSEAQKSADRLGSLWTQVAHFFQEYNDSLIFETLNEPRIEGITEEWSGGTSEGRGYVNDFHKAAVDAIRATGGNNEKRHLMIPTWAASTVPIAMEELVIPNDDEKIIISLHSYFPWPYAGEATTSWGSDDDKSDLIAELDKIKEEWIVERKRPVILGEWGTIEANSLQSRINYGNFYAKEAAARGLLTIVWDDGGNFRLFNRRGLSSAFGDVAAAIVAGSQQ